MKTLRHWDGKRDIQSPLAFRHDQLFASFTVITPEDTHHEVHTRAAPAMTIPFPSSADDHSDHPPSPTHPASPPPPAPQSPSNGMGVTGLVTGIVGACLAWVPILGFILGVLGIVFGGIGLYYVSQGRATNKGAAIAGLVLGVFAVVFWPLLFAVIAGAASTPVTP